MARKFLAFSLVLLFASTLSFTGCGSAPEFEETEMPDAEQAAEAEEYSDSYEEDQKRMREQYKR